MVCGIAQATQKPLAVGSGTDGKTEERAKKRDEAAGGGGHSSPFGCWWSRGKLWSLVAVSERLCLSEYYLDSSTL